VRLRRVLGCRPVCALFVEAHRVLVRARELPSSSRPPRRPGDRGPSRPPPRPRHRQGLPIRSPSGGPGVRRDRVLAWFDRGLDAVDARRLVANRLSGREPCGMIAIGKAAMSMAWGAADDWGAVSGVCVCDSAGEVPAGAVLLVGDHPVPSPASFAAGRRLREVAATPGRVILLLAGGGSAVCGPPPPHVPEEFVAMATRRLLAAGPSIGDTNLVRSHLSALKAGGLARAAGGDIRTLALSDVGPLGPETIASGPTLSPGRDPEPALRVMRDRKS